VIEIYYPLPLLSFLIFDMVKYPHSGVRKGWLDIRSCFPKKDLPALMRLGMRFLRMMYVSTEGVSWNKK
jgi:hypothetical protein